jgi:5-methylcytosine-specific restriction endonuclease McrA
MPHTKEQKREWARKKRIERRKFIYNYLGSKCSSCGTTDKLEVDHIDPVTKSNTVSHLLTHSEARLLEELDKCQLLCTPCHKKKTALQRGYRSKSLKLICTGCNITFYRQPRRNNNSKIRVFCSRDCYIKNC